MVTDTPGEPHRSQTLLRESQQLFNNIREKRGIAWCLEGIAGLAGVQHRPWHAARLFGAAVVRAAISFPISPVERTRYERQVVLARDQLSEGAWMAAWAEGQALSLEQVMTEALDQKLNTLQREG